MRRRLLGSLLAVAVLASPASAHAERWVGADATGDARVLGYYDPGDPCYEPPETTSEAAPGEDITGLAVRHQPRTLVSRIRYAAAPTTTDRTFELYVRTPRRDLSASVFPERGSGRYRVNVFREPRWHLSEIDTDQDGTIDCSLWYGSSIGWECRHAEVELSGSNVTISIPRTCIGAPDWVRVGASSRGYVLEEEVSIRDEWGDHDYPADPSTEPGPPTYGERVHVGRGHHHSGPSNQSRVARSSASFDNSLVASWTTFPFGIETSRPAEPAH